MIKNAANISLMILSIEPTFFFIIVNVEDFFELMLNKSKLLLLTDIEYILIYKIYQFF